MKTIPFLFVSCIIISSEVFAQPGPKHDLRFDHLAKQWDEAIPLGNGLIGALVWQKGDHLRFSLDRADLWDERPMKGLHRPEFSYKWVAEQVRKKEYAIVQQYFDAPYDREAAPSKIPGGALEFDIKALGNVIAVHLDIATAVCEVKWSSGATLKTFVHATKPIGWFRFEHLAKNDLKPTIIPPPYERKESDTSKVPSNDVSRLAYKQGLVTQTYNGWHYHQDGWNGFFYDIHVETQQTADGAIEGVWSLTSNYNPLPKNTAAGALCLQAKNRGYAVDLSSHTAWWKTFWSQSSLHVPDSLLERQWYLDQYKFGSVARKGAPPILLQAVWTADNGRLPPWKGDYHHDLNTELSYWPAYGANHLAEAESFIDHLDKNKATYKKYTKLYFGDDGLAVPGVTTGKGTEMGGWIQYALSPTVSCWLAQHYYWQWRYSMDKNLLKKQVYRWFTDVARHIEGITYLDEKGYRQLPISSSPEINNNNLNAWFTQTTNYDLALMKFTFGKAAELATVLGLKAQADHYKKVLAEFPPYAISGNKELEYAPGTPYTESHRHFSHLMAIHPLGLIQWEDGDTAQTIIKNTIAQLDKAGPDNWNGYSYAWLANIKARAKDGEGAAKALQLFAKAFTSVNSFHVNGDQTASGLSKRTYRPFTLEGNFAAAAGLQEMLLQSSAGFIEIMPAVPAAWKDVSFTTLRAQGAFLVSAKKEGGQISEVKIYAEKGGQVKLKLPFKTWFPASGKSVIKKSRDNGFIELNCKAGDEIVLKNGYE